MIYTKRGIFLLSTMLGILFSMPSYAQPYPYYQVPPPYPVNNYQVNPYGTPPAYMNPRFNPYNRPYSYNYNRVPVAPMAPNLATRQPIQPMAGPVGPIGPIGPLVPPAYPYGRNNPYAQQNNSRFPMNPFNNRSFSGKSFPGKSFTRKNSFFGDHGMPYERRFYERGPFDKDSWTNDEDDGQFGIFDIIPSNKFGEYWDGFIDGPNDSGDIPGSPIKWPQILMPDPFDVSEQLEDAAYETPSIPLYGTYGTTVNTSGGDTDYDDD